MSAIKEHLLSQIEEVRSLLHSDPNYFVVYECSEYMTIRCTSRLFSRPLAAAINHIGYAVECRQGINSTRMYVRAYFNQIH